jgi:hypothetical protein
MSWVLTTDYAVSRREKVLDHIYGRRLRRIYVIISMYFMCGLLIFLNQNVLRNCEDDIWIANYYFLARINISSAFAFHTNSTGRQGRVLAKGFTSQRYVVTDTSVRPQNVSRMRDGIPCTEYSTMEVKPVTVTQQLFTLLSPGARVSVAARLGLRDPQHMMQYQFQPYRIKWHISISTTAFKLNNLISANISSVRRDDKLICCPADRGS